MQQKIINKLSAAGIRRRMRRAHAVGALLLIVLVAAIQSEGLWQSHRQYEERAKLSSQNLGNVLAESIGGFFRNVDITLLAVIDQARLQERGGSIDRMTFDTALENLKNQVPGLTALRVTDAKGVVQFRTGQDFIDQSQFSVADRAYFQRLKANPRLSMIISEPVMGHLNNRWTLVCARPFYNADGQFGGIVFAAIELDRFAEKVLGTKIDLGEHGIFGLGDDQQNLIVSYMRNQQESTLIGKRIISPQIRQLIAAGVDSNLYSTESKRDGIERIAYYKRIPGQPLNVVVALASDDAFAGWRQERGLALITGLIFALFAGVGSWLLYRTRMRNVQTLDELAGAFNLNRKVIGNSTVGIRVHRRDGQCILVNAALCEIIGGTEEELLRINFRELPSWKENGALELAEQALATGSTHHLQAQMLTLLGRRCWLQSVFTSFFDRGERHLLVLVRDITEIHEAREELERSNRKLAVLSVTDGLTGLANRRQFDDVLMTEWRRAARHRHSLALAMFDVDLFKKYNDHFGHQDGDDCLRQVARVLAQHIGRAGDLVARYGGEEFVFIGPATDGGSAVALAEAIRAALEHLAIPHPQSPFGCVTLSIGVAAMIPADGKTPDQLLRRADEALYLAKQQGRNRVVFAE